MADLAARLGRRHRVAHPARRAAASTPVDRRTRWWRIVTAPVWMWSDWPAPDWPTRQPSPEADIGPAGTVFLTGLDAIRRRLWLRGLAQFPVRGAWLALALAAVWMIGSLLLGGPAIDLRVLAGVVAAAICAGFTFALLAKPSRRRAARMLDRTYDLRERMTTAVDDLGQGVPMSGEGAPIVYLQMADAANVVDVLRDQRALRFRIPVREIALTAFWGLTLAALAFLRGVGGDPPPLAAGVVPPFAPMLERPPQRAAAAPPEADAPTVAEVAARADRSNRVRQDLQALADALADHAITRDAAAAIQQGAYEAAADNLRELATDADQISPEARAALADDLDAAAQRMTSDDRELRQSSQSAADGLRQGDRPAQEGLRSLAETVEQTGERVTPQSELANQMQRAQAAQTQGRAVDQEGSQSPAGQPGAEGGQQEQPQSGADPGQGADASGQSDQPGRPQQDRSPGGQQGQSASDEQGDGAPADQAGQGGQQGQRGEQSGGQNASAAGQQARGEQSDNAEGAASRGDGSSSGAASEDPRADGGDGGGNQQAASRPGQVERRVVEGGGAVGDHGLAGQVNQSLALPPGASQNQGVQTSSDGGSALAGSGAGVTTGGGDAAQEDVGAAGPDSNHVPAGYRGVVERYFSDDGSAP